MTHYRKKILNVGIFAHVDAGKTTTTEHILYESGATRALGSVDAGTAVTDNMDIERQRGISVKAAMTSFMWRDVGINLVDTPGHVDFLSEVERSLRVMDSAILIISAVDGVQPQTELVWGALQKLRIPTLIFVNKMDRVGVDQEAILEQIRTYLSPDIMPIQTPIGTEQNFQAVTDSWDQAADTLTKQYMYEFLAERDEALLESYVTGESISEQRWRDTATSLSMSANIFPLLYGSAARGIGIAELLDAIITYLPQAIGDISDPLSGIVFKIERNKTMGRMAYVRLYGGMLRNRDTVMNCTANIEEKVTQIRKLDGGHNEDIGLLEAGNIAIVCGLTGVRIGDVLGSPDAIPTEAKLAIPLLTVKVHWHNEGDYRSVVQAMQELSDEDPLLDVQWLKDERELHVKVMGPIQLEILSSILESRYGLQVTFGQPSVIYKETPKQTGEGYIAYTMPKPCWAVLRFQIEPGPRGSGLQYENRVRNEELLPQYQNEVARRVPGALQQGLLGWEVTDLKITLIEGQHHVWHTHPLDFAVATPMGIMDGLRNTGTALLEPMLKVRMIVPEESGGRAMTDWIGMRGRFEAPVLQGDRMIIEGYLPLATSMDYPVELASYSRGKGSFTSFFAGYEQCPEDVVAERQRHGVNPLDQAKYILSVRNALQS